MVEFQEALTPVPENTRGIPPTLQPLGNRTKLDVHTEDGEKAGPIGPARQTRGAPILLFRPPVGVPGEHFNDLLR